MHIMHVALGGCLRPEPVAYGVTQDTGGHIAYVLGAARAQVDSDPANRVSIVTRAFDDPVLGKEHGLVQQRVCERLTIHRLRTRDTRYLSKADLMQQLPALQRAFLALIKHERPDVIHAHFADAAGLAFAARRRLGVPVLYTPHSLSLDKARCGGTAERGGQQAARLSREQHAIAHSDRIIVSSEDERQNQVGAYDAAAIVRTRVARPGVSAMVCSGTDRARALIDPVLAVPERPFLLAVARPVPKKNLPMLLEAYALDADLQQRCNLVMLAGQHERVRAERDEQSAELDRLRQLVDRHGLHGKVALPPSHAQQDVPELYELARKRGGLFVNPALHEPFGLTLIESARFGLPVVATSSGGPREIVQLLEHGLLIDPGDRCGLAAACSALLSDRSAYNRASVSGRRNAYRYRWRNWAATVAEDIDELRLDGDRAATAPAPAPRRRPAAPAPSHFLACDIDGTLTGSATGVNRFRRWLAERTEQGPCFAVATGRELPEAQAVLTRWRLPAPSVWITSVGTEIWRADRRGELKRCQAWAARLSLDWHRDAVVDALRGSGLRFQGPRTQRPWKVSVFGTAADAARLENLPALRALRIRIIASHERFIDLVPGNAGKAAAIEFDAARHRISMDRCVAAGDSGNDADMLARCGKGIIVGNALPEIAGLRERDGLYRACAHHAHGVLEGLEALGLLVPGNTALPRARNLR